MYYYADGRDKSNNRLITSYKDRSQAEKYRKDSNIQGGLKYLDTENSVLTNDSSGGLLVRTLMVSEKKQVLEGDFVIYARNNGVWEKTQFRYTNYALGNQAIKSALINLYEAVALVEERPE